MTARGSILGRKQEAAIAALLTQRNVEEAARAAGIGARKLLRWGLSVSFHQLHRCGHNHSRIKQVLYCQAEDKPVSRSELARGFEYEKDRYVIVEDAELDRSLPESARVMEILEFVKADEVDPLYLDASYYVLPEPAGEKPYALLFECMRRAGYAGIAKLTVHHREHTVVLRPGRSGLVLHTMYYQAARKLKPQSARATSPTRLQSKSCRPPLETSLRQAIIR